MEKSTKYIIKAQKIRRGFLSDRLYFSKLTEIVGLPGFLTQGKRSDELFYTEVFIYDKDNRAENYTSTYNQGKPILRQRLSKAIRELAEQTILEQSKNGRTDFEIVKSYPDIK